MKKSLRAIERALARRHWPVDYVLRVLCLATIVAWSWGSFAGYDVRVNSVPNFLEGVKSIAIVPATCSASANCIAAEQDLALALQKYKRFTVIPAEAVRQAMMEAGFKNIDESALNSLRTSLNADVFLIPTVGAETSSTPGVWAGAFVITGSDVSTGSLHLTLVDAKTGRTLMDAAGFGESDLRSRKGVVKHTIQEILLKAFGEHDDRPHLKDEYHPY